MKKHKHLIAAVVVTYVVISFMPQLGLLSLFSGIRGSKSKRSQ